jgi:hypothetical protein
MSRAIVSVLVAIGGTAGGLWLQNRNVDDRVLIVVFVICYTGAAAIAWWPRWVAAFSAFRTGQVEYQTSHAHGRAFHIDRVEFLAVYMSSDGKPVLPPLEITSITPAAGIPGTKVRIIGRGFQPGIKVHFGNVLARNITFISSTEISCEVPDLSGLSS